MNKRISRIVAVLFVVPCLGTVAFGAPDVEGVLKQMPADMPVGAVIVDLEKFDKSIIAYAKAINPKSDFEGILPDMKKNLGVAPWIDFTKPVGMAQPNLQGGEPILWASIPNFKEKVKTVVDAKEEEGGIWFLPFAEMDDLYAVVKGDMVIAASDKTQLEAALKKEGRTLADELRPRLDLLTNRDLYVHLNFEAVRPMAVGGIAQAGQMAPMMAMMAAQQGGGDPASMTAVFSGVLDAVKNFAEQATFVDITLGITATSADATIATGFKDGEIKNYLTKTKPASAALLGTLEEQPFTMALGWQIPGEDSPFLNYLFDKMGSAPAAGGAAPAAGEKSAGAEGSEIARDLYRKVEGQNMVMHMTKEGMTSSGDYLGKDVAGIQSLAAKSMVKENPLSAMMTSGISYEASGNKKLGDKSVDQFAVKIDPANPSAEQAKKMMGPNTTVYMGPVDGRVGFYQGPEAGAEKFFSGKVAKPFASGALVAEALKALPAKRNLVILLDPAGVLPAFGPMLGMDLPENIPPGPPVGIATSLSGEYARTDIHVPAKAIARVMEAISPAPPM